MSHIFFSSDHHFHHKRIREFCPKTRVSISVQDMNEKLIAAHNATVGPRHEVYFLGDLSFGTEDETLKIVRRLNGQKHLILGNHDKVIRNSREIQSEFESVQEYKVVRFNKEKFILCHFPFRQWDSMHHGSIHLYGHCHGNIENAPHGRSMDVGIDARAWGDMKPWSVDEVLRVMKNRQILEHH